MAQKHMSPREYAVFWGVHYNTVYNWIKRGLLPNVISQRIFLRNRYYIPYDTIPPRPYPGPKPKRRVDAVLHNLCDNEQNTELPGQLNMLDDPPPWDTPGASE